MKFCFYASFILIALASCTTQKKNALTQNKEKTSFQNQGEQEEYWTDQAFIEHYKRQPQKKYKARPLITNSDTIKYGNYVLVVNEHSDFKEIFSSGLIYPELFSERFVSIANIEELKRLNTSPKIKRFRCWVWLYNFANPTVYLFELQSKRADYKTQLHEFISGARLTFIYKGWVII